MASNNTLEFILKIRDEGTAKIKAFSSELKAHEKQIQDLSKSLAKHGAVMTASITLPLTAFGKGSMDLAVQTETAWKEIQKVYGDTAEAFVNDSNLLSNAVDELTIKFGKGKVEVLNALADISAMGYEGADSIDMLTQSLEFSIAGNLELADGMNAVIAISKIYQKQGVDLTNILATLNQVENKTAASMGDLGEAISIVGTSANLVGVDVNELSSFMAVLRERNIAAGEAANGLKTIMTRALKPTKEATDVYKKYGITIEKTTDVTKQLTKTVGGNADEVKRLEKQLASAQRSYEDYKSGVNGANYSDEKRAQKLSELEKKMNNIREAIAANTGETLTYTGVVQEATGEFKEVDEILIDIAKHWNDMTDAEKEAVIESNANMYQRDKFASIMEDLNSENSTYLSTLKEITNEEGSVTAYFEEMNVFLDSNATKIAQAKAKWDEMRLAVGNVIMVAFVPLMQTITGLALEFTKLNPAVQQFIVYSGAFLAAVGPMLVITATLITSVQTLLGVLGAIPAAFLAVNAAIGPVGWAIIGLTVAVGAFAIAWQNDFLNIREHTHNFLMKVQELMPTIELLAFSLDPLNNSMAINNLHMIEGEIRAWNLKNAEDNLRQATDALTDAENRRTDAHLALEGSELAVERATRTLEDATKKYGAESLEAREASHNLKLAEDRLEEAHLRVASAEEEATQKADEYAEAQDRVEQASKNMEPSVKSLSDVFLDLAGSIGGAISKLSEYAQKKLGIGGDGRGFADGGWVGYTGPATVHAGEYVLSRDMLSGKKPIAQSVMNSISNSNNQSVNVYATINNNMDAVQLGQILGFELATRGRYL